MRKRDFSLNSLAEMARRSIKAKVPDTHGEQRLFVVTAGENPQLDGLQLVGVCSTYGVKAHLLGVPQKVTHAHETF